ncbi:DNA-binding CsgD family transcriptional regulator/tetratricopeptide (TPR) repeat protein/nucleoside-triphosphatase THEP1 [Streptomyces luteogriseus]|uniref:helix-turn-helix transcriptional regulator n=1 Tax=Streptomyces luteogriseus TaxID=68233 RepID=UPI0027825D1A|nr:helix-turn-helix transcriptional regulator [Streptomyces luteogriseus]MDQ0716368.1 DNA-binding CsgD family transcriptional regulator/tetratricopeptide (TPR) repeat protein/nucleoside-triphosphatase THEP1 [Streptomyces luteogriseus]
MLGAVETRSVSPVFVGRAEELGTLHDALVRACEGEPQALLIGGEAGVGKTRLVEEFAAAARHRGAVVALGGCVEIGADGLPFAPFSTALRALRRELPGELAAAAAGQEEELARLLPELGESKAGRHDEDGMARLFELTARLLERVAAEHTVVLALEDLHWADASTRHLLSYLFRTLRTGRLVVLATYRSDDIHRRHPLRPLLAELDRLRTIRRLELARFNRDEVCRQVAGILAHDPEPDQVDAIFERSDGNAFFVEELAVAAHDGCRTGLTDSLRDLLLVRVEGLPEAAQQIARIVAEGGSTVEYRLLAAVARLAEDDLIGALRAAVNASILAPAPGGDGYRFRHSLVREAVSDDLLPGERSRLNRRYAEALETDPALVPADQRATRLASYWYHAHDAAKALPAVLEASVEARRRHAYSEQLRLLERAMELWDAAPDAVRRTLRPVDYAEVYPPCGCDPATTALRYLDLLAEAAVAGRLCGERERALKITKRALRLLDEEGMGDAHRAAWFWIQRSRLVQGLARSDGWKEIATAQDLVRGLPPSEVHAEVLATAAHWSMLHEPGPDALTAAERAVEYARMVGADDIESNARLTLGGLMVDAGQIDTGLGHMYDVRDEVVARGLAAIVGRSHVNLPSVLEGVGRSEEAVGILREGLRLTGAMGLRDAEAWIWSNLAESLISLGRWDEAADAAGNAQRRGQTAGPHGSGANCLAFLALARGQVPEAARHLAQGRAAYGPHDPMPQHDLPISWLTIALAAAEGRLTDARAELARTLDSGFPLGTQRYAWPLLLQAATAEADARALPAARDGREQVLDGIFAAVKRLTTHAPVWLAHEQWVRAELHRAEGRSTPGTWSEVVTAFEPLGRPYDLARVRYRLAESLLTGGGEDERDRATELLRLAHTVARHLGAGPLADAATALGRRARLPLTPATQPGPAPADPAEVLGLTSRERDVLRLVAAGHTNRRIAQELFISPKTASVHVSNILGKLGVSGRGEAAAVAHRLGLFPAEMLMPGPAG